MNEIKNLPVRVQDIQDRRLALVSNEEVNTALKPAERLILKAATKGLAIRHLPELQVIRDVKLITPFILKDVGIKGNVDEYQATRFYDILTKYYSNLTISEVKLAFEMALVGELDEYLPKNKDGEPDKAHYQEFSIEYVTKILNAYKKIAGNTWHTAYAALPEHVEMMSEEDKARLHAESLTSLNATFLEYKRNGYLNVYLPFFVASELARCGLIDKIQEPTNEDKARGLYKVLAGAYNEWDKKTARMEHEAGVTNRFVDAEAQSDAYIRTIKACFDRLISEGKELKDLLT